jgi:hypothetical protein
VSVAGHKPQGTVLRHGSRALALIPGAQKFLRLVSSVLSFCAVEEWNDRTKRLRFQGFWGAAPNENEQVFDIRTRMS